MWGEIENQQNLVVDRWCRNNKNRFAAIKDCNISAKVAKEKEISTQVMV